MRPFALVPALLVPLFMAGCRSPGSAPPDAWRIEGKRVIACCCGTPCPCRMNYKPMHAHGCDSPTIVHVERGAIRGVRVDGLTWIIAQRTFAENPSTNWTYVYLDDRATDEQYEAVVWLLENALASTAKNAEHTIGEFRGMRRVPIAWGEEPGDVWAVSSPGLFEARVTPIVTPGHSRPVVTTGVHDDYGDSFTHCHLLRLTYDDPQIGEHWELSGRQANRTSFVLTPQRVAAGGIGWGCWSAHEQMGNASQYQERMIGHH